MATQRASFPVPRLWRGAIVRPEARKATARRRSVFALQASIMALVGAIVGMLYWIKPIPAPKLVPLLASAPESHALVPLPMADADLRAFARLNTFTHRGKLSPAEDRIRMVTDLDDLKSLPNAPIVVYLRAYSRVSVLPQARGEPASVPPGQIMILPADADPVNPTKWISLRSALNALAACRSSNKLLLLDIIQPSGDPASDLLGVGKASRLDDELKAVPDPYRLVLTACSPGEPAHASDALGRSVFNYYLEEGLHGWADVDATGYHRDGIVTVADLAGFVSAHVDRWARQNRHARQRPVLYHDARRISHLAAADHDFPLAVLARSLPRPHLALVDAKLRASYPQWLVRGWRSLQHWRNGGSTRAAPWGFRRVEAALVWADQSWRAGADAARIEAFLEAELATFGKYQEKLRATPRPDPHSLAVLIAAGVEPDPALVSEVQALAKRLTLASTGAASGAVEKKPSADEGPLTAAKDASDRDLALAVVRVAAELPEPSSKVVIALDNLLKARGAPQFVETLVLRRLADSAEADPASWSPSLAHRVLDVTRKAAKAENRPISLDWVSQSLDAAAQARHDGEVMLAEPGFASREAAETLLGQAERLYEAVISSQDVIIGARATFDDATFLLPACERYLEDAPQIDGTWSGAIVAARDVVEALQPGIKVVISPSPAELAPRVDALRQKSALLQSRLTAIRTYLKGRADSLAQSGGRIESDAVTCTSIDRLLDTPFPSVESRLALWKARHEISRRLAEETLKLDRETTWSAPDTPDDEEDDEVVDRILAASAARRARRSIDLLVLGGLSEKDVSPLVTALGKANSSGTDSDWLALALELRRAWVDQLPAAIQSGIADEQAIADRLCRILPPFAGFTARDLIISNLEDPALNPHRRLRIARESRLWAWLADRYQYEANDLIGSDLLSEAARGFRNLSPPAQHASVHFGRIAELPELTPERPSAEFSLELDVTRPGSDDPDITIDIAGLDSRSLRVTPLKRADGLSASFPVSLSLPESGRLSVPIRVEMIATGSAGPPLPLGFLVRARINGRSFHVRVPVTLLPASERLKLLLSDDPETPTAPRGNLRLRPVVGRQSFYLYLFNPTSRERKVSATLKVGDLAVPGGTAALTIGPGKVEKVDFEKAPTSSSTSPGAAAAPDPELPELKAPLSVIVADADHADRILARRLVRVEVASAAEYVRATATKFQPTGPGDEKNHLTVTLNAIGSLAGPACQADLILPQERIPVLIEPPTEGTYHGAVPADGTALTLRAEGLKLANFGSEKGAFYVNVDGRKRALIFRTSFATRGDATTPRLDFEPAVRLRSDDAAASGAKFNVDVEVDNPPPLATLEISLGRIGSGGFEADVVLPLRTPYRRHVGFGVRAGALAFEAAEADWSIPIDTSGVEGRARPSRPPLRRRWPSRSSGRARPDTRQRLRRRASFRRPARPGEARDDHTGPRRGTSQRIRHAAGRLLPRRPHGRRQAPARCQDRRGPGHRPRTQGMGRQPSLA